MKVNLNRIEFTLKALGAASIIVGGALGLWKYFDASEKEYRRPLWERQIAVYFEATNATGLLVSATDPQQLATAERSFWKLYYGPMALVEDLQVEQAMVQFGRCLRDQCEMAQLRKLSLSLAHACRASLGESWAHKLPELQGKMEN
ncbi:MAG: hypothetical protein QNJ40_18350 [Xanthomonadales bacterium]|nr:hypothetical protein [Xanthomonadales bacterium]